MTCTMQRIHKADRCLECKECDVMYYIAKAIAEEFEWQENRIEELNHKNGVSYVVADRTVTYDISNHKVMIRTSFFDQLSTNRTMYSWDESEKFKRLHTIAEYSGD